MSDPAKPLPKTGGSAVFVAAGILLSRLAGFVRQFVFSKYFGLESDAADAFTAAFRIPNFLQNLFGEGALSASFIPVYAGLIARGDRKEADRVAGAVAALLAFAIAVLVLIGVFATPFLVGAIAPGFTGAKRELTIDIVRVLFPGAGLLVLSAWCLGVLNSHSRFLLSYAAPVMWNVAMVATLVAYGRGISLAELPRLAVILAWGSVVGSALQLAVQIPVVLRLAPNLRFALNTTSEHVRTVLRNFLPALASRGVVQASAFIDTLLVSYVPFTGATTGLANAQLLYTLPVSLFGISISASELTAMSSVRGADPSGLEAVRKRLNAGLRQIGFFVIPSVLGFMALGDVVAAAIFESGRFSHGNAVYVWKILAGASIGLLASTLGRLYSSTYYALGDTRTPVRYALIRVAATTVLGWLFAFPLPRLLGLEPSWGTAGLTASAGIAGWIEFLMLRRTLNARIGATGLDPAHTIKLWISAVAAAGIAWAIKIVLPSMDPRFAAVCILGPFGLVYFALAFAFRIPEASSALRRLRR